MKRIALLPLTAIVLLGACDDSTRPTGTRPVGVRFGGGAPATTSAIRGSVVVSSGSNTLSIDTVKMTLEDIDLERTAQSIDCEMVVDADDHADCSDYFPGPYLVTLDLNGGLTSPLTLDAQEGTYDVASFDISVPDGGDPAQVAYLAAHPDMDDVSVRIVGRYNGTPFSFALDLRGDQEIAIQPLLEVTDGSSGPLALRVSFDVASWFRRPDGSVINPATICSADQSCTDRTIVEQNIERAIQSYSDR